MANVVKRGSKNEPRYYVQYVAGRTPEGKRLPRMPLPRGVQTMAQARQRLAEVERDLAAGKDPFAPAVAAQVVGPLMERWRGGLTNRSKGDDRSRIALMTNP